jgi:hypothetical protein
VPEGVWGSFDVAAEAGARVAASADVIDVVTFGPVYGCWAVGSWQVWHTPDCGDGRRVPARGVRGFDSTDAPAVRRPLGLPYRSDAAISLTGPTQPNGVVGQRHRVISAPHHMQVGLDSADRFDALQKDRS